MKKLILLMVAMIISLPMFAQYGTSKRFFPCEFRQLPNYAVAKENRTYFVNVETNSQISETIDAERIYNSINLLGWNKVDNPDNAYLRVNVNIDYLTIEDSGVKTTETSEKSGETTKVVKHFFGKLVYTMPYHVELVSESRTQKYGRGSDKAVEFVTEEKSSYESAKKYISDNKDMLKDKLIKSEVDDIISSINGAISMDYAYEAISENISVEFMDSKKSEFYDEQQKAIIEIREVFGRIKADSDIKVAAKEMQVYIDQFKAIADKLNDGDKKQKKAKVALFESIANMYYAVENFDMAKQYCETLLKEYEEKSAGKMLGRLEKVQSEMQKHNVTSRHFEL